MEHEQLTIWDFIEKEEEEQHEKENDNHTN